MKRKEKEKVSPSFLGYGWIFARVTFFQVCMGVLRKNNSEDCAQICKTFSGWTGLFELLDQCVCEVEGSAPAKAAPTTPGRADSEALMADNDSCTSCSVQLCHRSKK